MSKVDIKRLDSLSHNDVAATKNINDNFQALQKAVEDSLSRTGKTPNYMEANLDMNGRRIINGGEPVEGSDFITLNFFNDKIGEVEDVISSVADAKKAAQLASGYAATAVNAKNEAVATAKEVKEAVDDAQNSAALAEQNYQECRAIYEEIKNTDIGGGSASYVFREVEFIPNQFDTVYVEYPYSYGHTLCDISDLGIEPIDGLTGMDIFPTVTFSVEQADSGKFAPVADVTWLRAVIPGSQANTDVSISIYSKEPITEPFIIPTIKLDVVQWLKV